jgi:D-threo-aldose 1-dehydrogenase
VSGLKQRQVGQTAVLVTELGFGGGPAGNLYVDTTDEQTAAAMDRAWAAGIRYFDTAPHYGLGLSERRLGAAVRDQPREVAGAEPGADRLRPGGGGVCRPR